MATVAEGAPRFEKTTMSILMAVSFCHMLNDIMQSLLASLYPLFKANYDLDFVQIGLLTMTFQVTASLLQPVVGIVTDRWPMPYSLPVGMGSTFCGLILLGNAGSFALLLLAASLIGFGSAVFHPESSRVARLASGGRHGFAQSFFQVGGNAGQAIGPLLAAFIVLPLGQHSVSWFAAIAMVGMIVLSWVGNWYMGHRRQNASRAAVSRTLPLPQNRVVWALLILVLLTATKNVYMASVSSYFTFYVIDKFELSVQQAQMMLFLFLASVAVGTFLGGPIGDRFGARFVIWFSILGVIPFALLLPYANLLWTGVLSVVIGLIFASAFSAIVVFAQELVPGRVGLIAGVFFGFAFGAGGLGAALLGEFADTHGIDFVYRICSYLPLLGLLTVFLPRIPKQKSV
ncbi:MFS transporter [Rhizobium phaseoli]|uniref:Putative fosmidomycin antibiotic resistence permease protein n=1 Tax=Rhizobium etli (strain CIAT 652) TaxID=491916 RepID=B3Q4V8_RHIE6|nr:MFS transporter [Rhizobium phaseoli]ACE94239.1 putative fosmidomycin antibiotic resistence permease protein [Rhizobium etli CIAT 652]ANL37628.1 major facilitator superfamily protein [Rhizobium phaseoli]ANM01339.1 major facilitator superfamily protein [Rhizobium phaseoli]RUM14969.1 MFS transporter [Rhizobium phaseoli]